MTPTVDPNKTKNTVDATKSGAPGTISPSVDPISVIDDFEDNNIDEYANDTAEFSTSTSASQSGTYGLVGSPSTEDRPFHIVSTSGLNAYPSSGDTFQFYINLQQEDQQGIFAFGVQSEAEFTGQYEVRLNNGDPANGPGEGVYLIKRNGGTTLLASDSFSPSSSTWYRVEVDWGTGGTIGVDVYDGGTQEVSISGSDSSYTSGGIAFGAFDYSESGGLGDIWYDTVEIL